MDVISDISAVNVPFMGRSEKTQTSDSFERRAVR